MRVCNWLLRPLRKFVLFLLRIFPTMVINGRNDPAPYLIRRTLFWTPWVRIYLHEIRRSDDDVFLHCHPWSFTSLILLGGYVEYVPCFTSERRAGSLIMHAAEDAHRIQLRQDKFGNEIPAWTLVFCGRKKREWGFFTEQGWVRHDVYFAGKEQNHELM